jgi:hypothetical protein
MACLALREGSSVIYATNRLAHHIHEFELAADRSPSPQPKIAPVGSKRSYPRNTRRSTLLLVGRWFPPVATTASELCYGCIQCNGDTLAYRHCTGSNLIGDSLSLAQRYVNTEGLSIASEF